MSFDLELLGEKLQKYRQQFQVSLSELSQATGVEEEALNAYENGQRAPTGDEILILADFYRCDYKFFISNERVAPFEQTETLFRRYGNEFSKADRWAVQEVLYLAECESFLAQDLALDRPSEFVFSKKGTYFKGHGADAAASLRRKLGYADNEVPMDVYRDFRSIGIHVFRRQLGNSNVSGLYIKHPVAGKCVLVNYDEDVYRQRLTAAHEAAHAILDGDEDVIVSFARWDETDLVEIRAYTFAIDYLMPPSLLKAIPDPGRWDARKALSWASKLKVSTSALAKALSEAGLIDRDTRQSMKAVRVPAELKTDPEIPPDLSTRERIRREELLKLGLSTHYVNLCFEAYRREMISAARMAEMLLISRTELRELAALFHERLEHGV